jgi:acetyl-CoA carboxylase carboxyl transferase subunit alpha
MKSTNAAAAASAAAALQLTAQPALAMGVIDGIIEEPLGGAHRDKVLAARRMKEQLLLDVNHMMSWDKAHLRQQRFDRFCRLGSVSEG